MLNACRRHCGQHASRNWGGPLRYVCSTPVGIIAVTEATRKHSCKGIGSAQRLAASLRSAHDFLDHPVLIVLVLNAYRRHLYRTCERFRKGITI